MTSARSPKQSVGKVRCMLFCFLAKKEIAEQKKKAVLTVVLACGGLVNPWICVKVCVEVCADDGTDMSANWWNVWRTKQIVLYLPQISTTSLGRRLIHRGLTAGVRTILSSPAGSREIKLHMNLAHRMHYEMLSTSFLQFISSVCPIE